MKYPTDDHKQRLKNKPWYYPVYEELNQVLQKIDPNSHIVAPSRSHVGQRTILEDGKLDENNVIFFAMQDGNCHNNVDELLEFGMIDSIAYGYALSSDGLWRFHSWGKTKSGEIVETCSAREKYFGVLR